MDILKTYLAPTRVGGPASAKGKAAELQKQQSDRYSIKRLLAIFVAWKTLIFAVASCSAGPGYDTSTQILLDQHRAPEALSWLSTAVEHVVLRLTRWDALYFASGSLHGQVYEQEWAFSWALSKATSLFSRALLSPFPLSPIVKHALAGICISHISHLLAVLSFYALTLEIIPAPGHRKRAIAFTAAALHIVSPAGIFLSAPYGESTFAFLTFAGTLCYVHAAKCSRSHALQHQSDTNRWIVRAGFLFGLAVMIRSNGLLSGIPFAWDVVFAPRPRQNREARQKSRMQLIATVAAGSLVAWDFVLPQIVAFTQYCQKGNARPWCTRFPPSIYSWVQEHYWEVGLFKYWTLNNVPLFLLAAPMLFLLLWSGNIAFRKADVLATLAQSGTEKKEVTVEETKAFTSTLPRLALPQLVLVVMAATSFHVQIVNRVSSGYAVWYIVLAIAIHASSAERKRVLGAFGEERTLKWTVRVMVVYAVVQAGLFASFLPPA